VLGGPAISPMEGIIAFSVRHTSRRLVVLIWQADGHETGANCDRFAETWEGRGPAWRPTGKSILSAAGRTRRSTAFSGITVEGRAPRPHYPRVLDRSAWGTDGRLRFCLLGARHRHHVSVKAVTVEGRRETATGLTLNAGGLDTGPSWPGGRQTDLLQVSFQHKESLAH